MGKAQQHSFIAYIDESGHYNFHRNSSDWFVLSAFVVDTKTDMTLPKKRDEILQRIITPKQENKHLHMKDVSNSQKKLFVAKSVSEIPACCISIMSHKKSLGGELRRKLSDGNKYYEFMARHLIQKISWYCSQQNETDNAQVKTIFSKRDHIESYTDLQNYLEKRKENENRFQKKNEVAGINWNTIDINAIQVQAHATSAGLQLADVVAYSFFKAVEKNNFNMIEEYYAKLFEDRVYRHKGIAWGNGVTVLGFNKLISQHIPHKLYELYKN